MSTILGIESPEGVRLKRQRGLVVLAPEAKAVADAALPRMERLRACSIRAMSAMGHVLEAQGETDTPTLFDGWARLFFSKVASKREAAIQAFDAAMERATAEAAAQAHAQAEKERRSNLPLMDPAERARLNALGANLDEYGEVMEPEGGLISCGVGRFHPNADAIAREKAARAKAEAAAAAKAKGVPESVKRAREAAKTLEEALHKDGDKAAAPAPGKLVQGSTGGSHKGQILKAALGYHGYDVKDTDKFGVILFGKDGGTDAVKFNGKVFDRSLPQDAGVDEFSGTNILPINLGDPTPERPWDETELDYFYDAVDVASGWLKAGKLVIVACVAGANRSIGVCRALEPNPHKWPAPTCPSMDAAAAGWRAGHDLTIAPLAPPPKTAVTRARK